MDFLIKLSYQLENSARYAQAKQFLRDLLENAKSPLRLPFDLIMSALVITSIGVLIYNIKNPLGELGEAFETFAIAVFILEYLLRMWVFSDIHASIIRHYEQAELLDQPLRAGPVLREILRQKWDYMTQPMAIIDLLAILPNYRPIRLLRIFLIFRLLKLLRYTSSLKQFTAVLTEKRYELLTLGVFLAFVVFSAAAAIYIFEADVENTHIHTLYDAIYWSVVTLSTVGYGDITPQTDQGRAVAMLLIVTGIGVISFFTSIIVSAFTEKLPEIARQRLFNEMDHSNGHTIMCGYGRLGQNVAKHLQGHKDKLVVIDNDPQQVMLARKHGYLALLGNAESAELLENLNIRAAKRILCMTDNDVSNVYVTLSARQMNPDIHIIAKANQTNNRLKLERAGANHAIAPYETVGMVAAQYAGQPIAFEAFFGLLTRSNPITVEALRLHRGSALIGQCVGDTGLLAHKLILFGIAAETERPDNGLQPAYPLANAFFSFNPPASFPLFENDLLIVFGHEYNINAFREQYGLFKTL